MPARLRLLALAALVCAPAVARADVPPGWHPGQPPGRPADWDRYPPPSPEPPPEKEVPELYTLIALLLAAGVSLTALRGAGPRPVPQE
jgi:hypothetical protein